MKTNDLENELRNLRFTHLTESEMAAYCDQKLDQMHRIRVEAHLKQCFICGRQLALLREEALALSNHHNEAEDVALVEQLMQQTAAQDPSAAKSLEIAKGGALQERLAEYLRQMVVNWQISFKSAVRRGRDEQGEEVWRWQSEDGKLQARAMIEKNADLTIHFSSNEIDLEGMRLNIHLGQSTQEITLQRVSESEVYAKVAVPWQQRQGNTADISIERV
jgi:ribosomal protein S15P/S13E